MIMIIIVFKEINNIADNGAIDKNIRALIHITMIIIKFLIFYGFTNRISINLKSYGSYSKEIY